MADPIHTIISFETEDNEVSTSSWKDCQRPLPGDMVVVSFSGFTWICRCSFAAFDWGHGAQLIRVQVKKLAKAHNLGGEG